jgi:hypothetical protein
MQRSLLALTHLQLVMPLITRAWLLLCSISFTRPDIAYVVPQVCLYMHDPRETHMTAVMRIIRYLQGTVVFGLTF